MARERERKQNFATMLHRQRTADDWGINYVFRISRISLPSLPRSRLRSGGYYRHEPSLDDFINSTCKYLLRCHAINIIIFIHVDFSLLIREKKFVTEFFNNIQS